MPQDILGSKIPTFASDQVPSSTRGYGQNGSAVSPSQPLNKTRAISKNFSDISPPAVSAAPGSWQTRTISAKALKASPGMRDPNASPAKVPNALNRGTVAPSVKPAPRGNAKR